MEIRPHTVFALATGYTTVGYWRRASGQVTAIEVRARHRWRSRAMYRATVWFERLEHGHYRPNVRPTRPPVRRCP